MAVNSTQSGVIKLEGIANFRDVGAYTNAISGVQRIKPGLLFRSARTDYASPADRDILSSNLKIKTIIDLRSKTELLQVASANSSSPAQKPSSSPASSASLLTTPSPTSNSITAQTIRVNLNGLLYTLHLLYELPFPSLCRLLYFYATGQRIAAIRIISTVLSPKGLTGLAKDSLLHSWREIRTISKLLSENGSWPVLVHCTQGKDRTGLIVLLLLMLCGVDKDAAKQDYLVSAANLKSEREQRLKEIREVAMPDSFADCEEGWVENVWDFIEHRWGSVEGYLRWCGVEDEQVTAIKDILLHEAIDDR